MEFVLFDLLASGVGWLCLFFRYRSTKKRAMILQQEYDGSYEMAGKKCMLQVFGGILLMVLMGCLLVVLLKAAKLI